MFIPHFLSHISNSKSEQNCKATNKLHSPFKSGRPLAALGCFKQSARKASQRYSSATEGRIPRLGLYETLFFSGHNLSPGGAVLVAKQLMGYVSETQFCVASRRNIGQWAVWRCFFYFVAFGPSILEGKNNSRAVTGVSITLWLELKMRDSLE